MRAKSLQSLPKIIPACGVVALVLSLVLPIPFERDSLSARALQDALHVPCFALLVVLLHSIVRWFHIKPSGRELLLTILVAMLTGGLAEAAQAFSNRTPSGRDLFHNLLGIAAGTAILLAWKSETSGHRRLRILAALLVCAGALGIASLPWFNALDVARQQVHAFPMLGDFEEPWEKRVWIPQGHDGRHPTRVVTATTHATRGDHSLEVATVAAPWSGIRLMFESSVRWAPDRALCFDLAASGGQDFTLGIRVDADTGERFTGQTTIRTGEGRYRIRAEDLRNRNRSVADTGGIRVETVVFHLGANPPARRFHLDHVRLE